MQAPRPRSTQAPRYLPGRLIISAPPEHLNQLEQHAQPDGLVGQQLGTSLTSTSVADAAEAPAIYKHDGESWQAVTPGTTEADSDDGNAENLLANIGKLAGETLQTAYKGYLEKHDINTRRYQVDTPTDTSKAIANNLSDMLNNPNDTGLTGFDISPDHVISYAGGQHDGDSPWRVPARTAVADPETKQEPEALFGCQACWESIGAGDRANFEAKGEGVTVVILDTLPDLTKVNPKLIDLVIRMQDIPENLDQAQAEEQPVNLKELYSLGRIQPDPWVRPGGADIDEQVLEPYHGLLIASLIRELAPAAKIVIVEVLNNAGEGSGSEAAEALGYIQFLRSGSWQVDGQRLIEDKLVFNLSLGLPRSLSEDVEAVYFLEACERLADNGAVIVAAAGNDSYYLHPQNPEEPAAYGFFCDSKSAYESVIAVSAAGQDLNSYALYSNQGNLAAPGMDLLMDTGDAENPGGTQYAYWTGTSFATPLVTSAAALLLSAGVDPKEVKQTLWKTASQPQRWNQIHQLDIANALKSVAK